MERITLAHGSGGEQTRELIESVFFPAFENPSLTRDDAALLAAPAGRLALTTDSFVVSPPFFPGGDIGKLSVCGTVNDLSCRAARPLYLTASFVIEEGFEAEKLKKIARSMAAAAAEAGAAIVAGDTKVVRKGQCDGLYITTAGVGALRQEPAPGGDRAREGDAVLVTGDIGRHGAAILVARGEFGLSSAVTSDCAPLWNMVEGLLREAGPVSCLRDATRGGLATVLCELAEASGAEMELDEKTLPVCDAVRGVCGLLGLEPLYLACEGRLAVILPGNRAEAALAALRKSPFGRDAAIVGRVRAGVPGRVTVRTAIGGRRLLAPPAGELLPRIC